MNAPAKVIELLGLSSTSQGTGYDQSFLYVILKLLAVSPPAATYDNPVSEVLHLLSAYSTSPAYARIAEMTNTAKVGR